MTAEKSLAIIKALADESRLAIVKSLLERSQYVEEIAKRHALAPSTVSFHLKKLEKAGLVSSRKEQYYVMVQANAPVFETTLKELVSAVTVREDIQDERMEQHRRKVLETFFPHGVLDKLPAQHKKRLIVLEQFAQRFEAGRRYSETEVTGLIRPLFDDYCTVRRLLVDEGMIRRDDSGYWREGDGGGKAVPLPQPKGDKEVNQQEQRAAVKRLHKQNVPGMGIYQLRNTANGRIYIDSSNNLESTRKSRMFQLRMGKVVFSHELQDDLNRYGADSFEFGVLEVLSDLRPGANVDRELLALKLRWQDKLHPFGDQGYNSLKGFERERKQINILEQLAEI
ncbi:metalloregulator ArsR/SmtB family transcription factor [Geomonas sp. Red32]|uniref:metalloregulator ArsR/SmtB family transcription factor n=1 Tax=Geomonas sp. Red32 TaxID=2912856 RepID=UPI00202CA74D|nr:metalloregulator ArsR/SmtB family transcription factor [Geomonas sp. Red32]MCM0081897.1 metalloregulator ArsR/SmtB family transcription factor [Geomonas sp. Red32]